MWCEKRCIDDDDDVVDHHPLFTVVEMDKKSIGTVLI